MKFKTFHFISLGCAKNTVDSDSMAQLLTRSGYKHEEDPTKSNLIIVNTCGFIKSAKEESFSFLKEVVSKKNKGQLLIAAGCLTQRYGTEVLRQAPGIDGLLGTRRWMDIVEVVEHLSEDNHPKPLLHLPQTQTVGADEKGVLRVSQRGNSAYLKIADGCRRSCAFCAIPSIKGALVSRPKKSIIKDALALQRKGVRELVLISQDTTDYGHDMGLKDGLALLLESLIKEVPNIDWIRIMYTFPGFITERLIEVMATNTQIVPYLDIPLQHAHPDTLRRMRRPTNIDWIYKTLKKMRTAMPDLAIRTTFIVGYPGETDSEFKTLLDFVRDLRFEHVGAFKFSFEPGTASESLGDPIPSDLKQERFERLMECQQPISLEINQQYIGKKLDVLIEGHGDGLSLGRSYRDAPEVDGMVIIENELAIGEMLPIQITGAMPYDLYGTPLEKRN